MKNHRFKAAKCKKIKFYLKNQNNFFFSIRNNQQDQNDELFENPMVQHYSDPKHNAFVEDGLTINSVKEKNPRVYLSYPVSQNS